MNGLDALKEEMLRPHSDLEPLLRFRGSQTATRVHAYWNFVHAMRLNECESLSDGTRLYRAGELPHLCGFHAKNMPRLSLQCFVSRLRLTPKVTDFVPGLTDYVTMILPHHFTLQVRGDEVSPSDARWSRNGYRTRKNKQTLRAINKSIGKSADVPYLFVPSSKDNDLMAAVHQHAVSRRVPHAVRSDLCQDLLCSIIAGEISVENVPDVIDKYLKGAKRLTPHTLEDYFKYGAIRAGEQGKGDGGSPDAWKELYQPDHACSMEDRIEDLAEHWQNGVEPEPVPVNIVSPMSVEPRDENFDEMQRRVGKQRLKELVA